MRKRSYTLKITAFFLLLLLGNYSCSDDFVDVDSFDEDSENFFNSEQDYQDALIAAYDMLQSTYLSSTFPHNNVINANTRIALSKTIKS